MRGINTGTHFLFCGGRLVVGGRRFLRVQAGQAARRCLACVRWLPCIPRTVAILLAAGPDWKSLLGSTCLIVAPMGALAGTTRCGLLACASTCKSNADHSACLHLLTTPAFARPPAAPPQSFSACGCCRGWASTFRGRWWRWLPPSWPSPSPPWRSRPSQTLASYHAPRPTRMLSTGEGG